MGAGDPRTDRRYYFLESPAFDFTGLRYKMDFRTTNERRLEAENVALKTKLAKLEIDLARALRPTPRFNELKVGFSNFLQGVAKAQILRGILRSSRGHKPAFGTNPAGGEQWTTYEVAEVFGNTTNVIGRLQKADAYMTRCIALQASTEIPRSIRS